MSTLTVHRVEVRPTPEAGDPHGASVCATAQAAGLDAQPTRVDTSNIYLLEGDLSTDDVQQLAADLLADPVAEMVTIGATAPTACQLIEVHPQPGVMDPAAEAVEAAIEALLGNRA